jgi:hypothetical protein
MHHVVSALQARLHQALASGSHASEVAERAVFLWREIVAAYAPIIGLRGATALLRRALTQSVTQYPWLAPAVTGSLAGQDFDALRGVLGQRSAADIRAANEALLQNFFDLLSNLIGSALTERLLTEALDHPAGGIEPQETSA